MKLYEVTELLDCSNVKVYNVCQKFHGHRTFLALNEDQKQDIIKYIKKQKTSLFDNIVPKGYLKTNEIAKKLNIHINKVSFIATSLNIFPLVDQRDHSKNYSKSQFDEIESFMIKKQAPVVYSAHYEDLNDVQKIGVSDYDFLNKLSFFLEDKYRALRLVKENIDPVNYKPYKPVFIELLNMTLQALPDKSMLKTYITNRFKVKNKKYKPESRLYKCPITKTNLKSVALGDMNETKMARHFLYTVGALNDIINNYDNFYIVQSNFACILHSSLNIIPMATGYKKCFCKRNNIKNKKKINIPRKIS